MNVRYLRAGVLILCLLAAEKAAAADYAPVDRPGPPLQTQESTLRSALSCGPAGEGPPVLLVAGTGATPDENYSWNYQPAFTQHGIPWCGVTVPDHTLADVQVQAEFIVFAIRTMYRTYGRRVSILGYSQGGMTPRWALRWWPDVRPMVDDMVSLAADNHGTSAAQLIGACANSCPAAAWQNLPGSALLTALNSETETFAGISYTQIFSNFDELSTPAGHSGTSPLRTGGGSIVNVALQDICAGNVADHLLIGSIDPVAWALVVDALAHPGPADPARIDRAWCAALTLPGADLAGAAAAAPAVPFLLAGATPLNLPGLQLLTAEPTLRCYVFARCSAASAATVTARFLGTSSHPGLLVAATRVVAQSRLRSLTVRLPTGFRSVARRIRGRVDGAPARAAARGRKLILKTAAGADRMAIRIPPRALIMGPRRRATVKRQQALRIELRTVDESGAVTRTGVVIHAARPRADN